MILSPLFTASKPPPFFTPAYLAIMLHAVHHLAVHCRGRDELKKLRKEWLKMGDELEAERESHRKTKVQSHLSLPLPLFQIQVGSPTSQQCPEAASMSGSHKYMGQHQLPCVP